MKNNFLKSVEERTEKGIFASRWLLAPFYMGLVLSLFLLLGKFAQEFYKLAKPLFSQDTHHLVLGVLGLLDLTLLANLILIMIFAGYENFVSKIAVAKNSVDRPAWMGRVDFAGLKIKLIGSLVAISVIELLRDFLQANTFVNPGLKWRLFIYLAFVVSGVLFALMDFISGKREAIDLAIESAETNH